MAVYDETNLISTGHIKKEGEYSIYYVGGSAFRMVIKGSKSDSTMKLTFDDMEKLVASKKIRLISPLKYNQIRASILEDGSTSTHNADGTLKNKRTQVTESLIKEHVLSPDGSSLIEDEDDEPAAPKMPENKVLGPEDVMDSIDDFSGAGNANPHDGRKEDTRSTNPSGSDDTAQQPVRTSRANNRLGGDMNGDGVVDEFDDIIKQEQSKNPLVMLIFFGGIIVSIFLFFFFHAITSGIFQGEVTLLPDIPALHQQPDNEQNDNAQDTANVQSQDGNASQQQPQQEQSGDSIETYKRTDFDPEDMVAGFPLADEQHEKIGVFLMQQIRQNFLDANWDGADGFLSSVDIDRIAGQLAPAYAELAKEVQNLTDLEAQELEQSWRTTFANIEHQHLLDKDPYGSIFCGRPREVRQDPNNPNCIYIVTESVAGDHQRACFAANGDLATNNWKITDILDPQGYCKMVQAGEAEL